MKWIFCLDKYCKLEETLILMKYFFTFIFLISTFTFGCSCGEFPSVKNSFDEFDEIMGYGEEEKDEVQDEEEAQENDDETIDDLIKEHVPFALQVAVKPLFSLLLGLGLSAFLYSLFRKKVKK